MRSVLIAVAALLAASPAWAQIPKNAHVTGHHAIRAVQEPRLAKLPDGTTRVSFAVKAQMSEMGPAPGYVWVMKLYRQLGPGEWELIADAPYRHQVFQLVPGKVHEALFREEIDLRQVGVYVVSVAIQELDGNGVGRTRRNAAGVVAPAYRATKPFKFEVK